MVSYPIYKIVHLVGMFMLFLAGGGAITNDLKNSVWRQSILYTYGLGLILTLVGGFGLMARIGVQHGHMPLWAMLKIGIWAVFLALIFVLIKKPSATWARPIWPLMLVLGMTAAYIIGSKPT